LEIISIFNTPEVGRSHSPGVDMVKIRAKNKMPINIKFTRNIIPPVLFMAVIFILSAIPIDAILDWVKYRFSGIMALRLEVQSLLHIRIIYEEIQNYLHVPFFIFLAFLWMQFFAKKNMGFRKSSICTALITLIFGVLDEFSQVFFAGRIASGFDLSLDIIGSLLGIGIYRLLSLKNIKNAAG